MKIRTFVFVESFKLEEANTWIESNKSSLDLIIFFCFIYNVDEMSLLQAHKYSS